MISTLKSIDIFKGAGCLGDTRLVPTGVNGEIEYGEKGQNRQQKNTESTKTIQSAGIRLLLDCYRYRS